MSTRLPTEIWHRIFGIIHSDLKAGQPYTKVYNALLTGALLCKDASEPAQQFLYGTIHLAHPNAAVKLYDTIWHCTPCLGAHTVRLNFKDAFGKRDMGSLILERLCLEMPNLTEMVLTPHQCSIAARNADLWSRLKQLVIDYQFNYREVENEDDSDSEEGYEDLTRDDSLKLVPSPPPNLEYLTMRNALHLLCSTQWGYSVLPRLKGLVLSGTMWYSPEESGGRCLPGMPHLVDVLLSEGIWACTETSSRFIHILEHELHVSPLKSLSMDLQGETPDITDLFSALRPFTQLQKLLYYGNFPIIDNETALRHVLALPLQRLELELSCYAPYLPKYDAELQFFLHLLAALQDAGTLSTLKQCPRISFSMIGMHSHIVSENIIRELEKAARITSERLSLRPGFDVTTDWTYQTGCRNLPILPCPKETYIDITKVSSFLYNA